jgi:hypothetical protein
MSGVRFRIVSTPAKIAGQHLGHGRQERQREGDVGLRPHDLERSGLVDVRFVEYRR